MNKEGIAKNFRLVNVTSSYPYNQGLSKKIYFFLHRIENKGKLYNGVETYINESEKKRLIQKDSHLFHIKRGVLSFFK